MINFHPTGEQLTLFAEGALAPEEAVVIASHIDMCDHCGDELHQKTELIAANVFHLNEPLFRQFQLDAMVEEITSSSIRATQPNSGYSYFNQSIQLDGIRFNLPRTLRKFALKAGGWSYLAGKTWQAGIAFNSEWHANFMYLEKGGHIPQHTFAGKAYWLVIEGEFSEGKKVYRKGDFISITKGSSKEPFGCGEKGCLLFALLEKPLNFSTGLANLLNPSSHLYF